MRLAWIEARDFRNHRETSLEVPPGLIAVVGPNGQGKTNLLEAMHYLCALESARVHSDLPLVRIGAPSAFVRGEILTEVGRFLVGVKEDPVKGRTSHAFIYHVWRVEDVAGLRAAHPQAMAAGAPALLALEVAFDPREPIPPYSERPDEIRVRFAARMEGGAR